MHHCGWQQGVKTSFFVCVILVRSPSGTEPAVDCGYWTTDLTPLNKHGQYFYKKQQKIKKTKSWETGAVNQSEKKYLFQACFLARLSWGWQGGDDEAVWVLTVPDFWLLHQGVEFLFWHILHLFPVHRGLDAERRQWVWGNRTLASSARQARLRVLDHWAII